MTLYPSKFIGKPICEILYEQKYFNGIDNFLRSEILGRANIPPFADAYSILYFFKILIIIYNNYRTGQNKMKIFKIAYQYLIEKHNFFKGKRKFY